MAMGWARGFAWLLVVGACGGSSQATPQSPGDDDTGEPSSGSSASGMSVSGAVGALDKGAVQNAVSSLNGDVTSCVEKGQRRLPFLEGELEVFVVVDVNGRATEAYLTESTLGDHEVELCIVKVFQDKQWPRPVGGEQGEITQSFAFHAGHGELPDVWTADQLADKMNADDPAAFGELERKLGSCRSEAGAGALRLTMYLDEDGLVRTAGAGMSDPAGEEALACAVTTLQTTSFPAPGNNFVKASLDLR